MICLVGISAGGREVVIEVFCLSKESAIVDTRLLRGQ